MVQYDVKPEGSLIKVYMIYLKSDEESLRTLERFKWKIAEQTPQINDAHSIPF
jgi:hypothetical protein